ncbi:MAG TPA: oligosaccharide flippase family protein [Myxococcales bacterium]
MKRFLRAMLGRHAPEGEAELRLLAVARGALSALGARGVALLVSFVAVPITVRHLGGERYGAWVTIGSTVAWLSIADLGLGNGLTSALAEALGRGLRKDAQELVATAFWLLSAVALACGIVFALAEPHLDWAAILNVKSELARAEVSRAATLAVALLLAGLPLSLVERVYAALHEGAQANVWSAIASVATLLALFAATEVGGGMALLVLALSGARVMVQALSGAWLFFRRHPEIAPDPRAAHFTRASRISTASARFFVIQIAGLVLYGTDNFIIARVLGPERVTPYSVTWNLFALPSLPIMLAFPYLWPAYTHALARRDVEWVRRIFRLSLAGSIGAAAAMALPLALAGRPLIAVWAGPAAVPPVSVLVWMAVWSVVNSGMNALACLLNAAEQITVQAACGVATAALNVVLSIVWGRAFGIAGVIAATVASFAALAVLPMSFDVLRLFRRLRSQLRVV